MSLTITPAHANDGDMLHLRIHANENNQEIIVKSAELLDT